MTGKLQTLIAHVQRGAYDELYTPLEAIDMLLPYIPSHIDTIWECTTDRGDERGNILNSLKQHGFNVETSHVWDGQSFFEYEPHQYDAIITNPPYSLKDAFLERAYGLRKPFAFLLPITALEGKRRSVLYRKYGIQVIVPNKRFNFKPDKNGAWFQTSWFTWGFNLDADLIFCDVSST